MRSRRAWQKLTGGPIKIQERKVRWLHILSFLITVLNLVYQFIAALIPLLYYMILLALLSCFLQLEVLSDQYSTAESEQARKTLIRPLRAISLSIVGFCFVLGAIPVQGMGSLCSDTLIYPIGFYILMLGHLLSALIVKKVINKCELLRINDPLLKDFYNSQIKINEAKTEDGPYQEGDPEEVKAPVDISDLIKE